MSQLIGLQELDSSKMLRSSYSSAQANLNRWNAAFTGYTHIFLMTTPNVLGENLVNVGPGASLAKTAATHGKNLKTLINFGSIGYSGTPDLTLNTTTLNVGNPTGGIEIPTFAQFDGNQFTIKMIETRSEPLRHLMEFWITAIGDPKSPHTHMHNLGIDAKTPLEPTLQNITCEILVVQTDQTLRNIQNYDLWQAAFPTGVSRSDLDWDAGSIDVMQAKDVQFKGVYVPKPKELEATVIKLMEARISRYRAYYDLPATANDTHIIINEGSYVK